MAAAGESLEIRVENATKLTRVHVIASRYAPAYPLFADLDLPAGRSPQMATLPGPRTTYVVGRDIGDEYRYVLDRKYAKKYSGVTLTNLIQGIKNVYEERNLTDATLIGLANLQGITVT